MPEIKPRGERIGWTRTEVSEGSLQQFKLHVRWKLDELLKNDPLPEEYELTGVTLHYRRGERYLDADEFSVMADFDEQALSVFRLEGVKR